MAQIPEITWEIVLCDLTGTQISDLSGVASGKQLVYRLNRPSQLTFDVPSDDPRVNILHSDGEPFLSCSNRVIKGYRLESGTKVLRFAGIVMQLEDSGDADRQRTAVTCFDPSQILYSRICRTAAGVIDTVNFAAVAGGTIAHDLVDRTVTYAGSIPIDIAGSFAATTAQTLLFEEGYTIGQALETLTDTQTMDVIFDPIDSAGLFAAMSVVAARGSNKPDAIFGYGCANYAVESVTRLLDGSELANTVKAAGGRPPVGSTWPTGTATDAGSITKYGLYESWRAIDPDISNTTFLAAIAAAELELRKQPREYLNVTPFPEKAPLPFTDYFLGDTIQIWTPQTLRQAVQGAQRVYSLTITIDDAGFESVGQILASSQ